MTDFIVAEVGIRQLYARCVDAVWRKDSEAFGDCFTEDAVWKIAGLVLSGRADISRSFGALLSVNERVLMNFGTPLLQVVDAGVATGRTYTVESVKRVDGQAKCTIGIYYERFVREGDCWRFQWRHFDIGYFGAPDLSEAFYDIADYGRAPSLPHADDPTTGYQVKR